MSCESVRNILKGPAPSDEQENRNCGIKKGLDFISDKENKISEENLYKLYMMTAGDFLDDENKLKEESFYRNDVVYIQSDHVEHTGISCNLLPRYVKSLIDFINLNDGINDL